MVLSDGGFSSESVSNSPEKGRKGDTSCSNGTIHGGPSLPDYIIFGFFKSVREEKKVMLLGSLPNDSTFMQQMGYHLQSLVAKHLSTLRILMVLET